MPVCMDLRRKDVRLQGLQLLNFAELHPAPASSLVTTVSSTYGARFCVA